jgi:hypothetical protein
MTTPAPARPVKIPPPVIQMPTCPLCNGDCDHDGYSLNCESCGVYWPDGDTHSGRRVEEFDLPECAAEHAPYERGRYPSLAVYRFRCVLDADHESDHRGVRCDVDYDGENVHVWANIDEPTDEPTVEPTVERRGVITVETAGGVL